MYIYARATDEYVNCQIMAIPSKMDFRSVAWTFQKHSPYLQLFNHYLKMMKEKGTLQYLYSRFKPPPQVCPDAAGNPIGFRNSITAFLAFASKYFFANYVHSQNAGLRPDMLAIAVSVRRGNFGKFVLSKRLTVLYTADRLLR